MSDGDEFFFWGGGITLIDVTLVNYSKKHDKALIVQIVLLSLLLKIYL